MSKETVFVYIITESENGEHVSPVKVGYSNNPFYRVCSLNSGNARELKLYCQFPTPNRNAAAEIERAFHEKMKDHRIRGEWFDVPPDEACQEILVNIRMCFMETNMFGELGLRTYLQNFMDTQGWMKAP